MFRVRVERQGSAWLELLLLLAVVALVFQLFPAGPQRLLGALDFRYWSRSTWFFANLGLLLLFLFVRLGPDLIDSWQHRLKAQTATRTPEPSPVRIQPREDARVLMRRDEQFRAKLRRKFTLYGLALPALVIMVGVVLAWSRSERDKATRAVNLLLPANSGESFQALTDGVVGVLFAVRSDRDVQVTHLGVYDHNGDGMQLAHRVGIFQAESIAATKGNLIVEATVPFGHYAPLEEGFRWTALEKPVTLRAGKAYVLAAESFGDVRDNWPGTFDGKPLARNGLDQVWNPSIVGEQTVESQTLLITDKPWPALPDREETTAGGVAHGLANLIIADAE